MLEAPSPLTDLEQQGLSQYLLYSRSEIIFVLRQVMQKKCMITAYFDAGRSFFLTTLVAISEDGNWIYLDTPGDEGSIKKVEAAPKVMLTTMLDRVKIQFSLAEMQTVAGGSRKTLAARLPETLLRLQRREHFRLSTPIANPLRCHLTLPATSEYPQLSTTIQVADISGGGIGLIVPDDLAGRFETGLLLPECRVDLPEEGEIVMGLAVRNAFSTTTKTGTTYLRVGCEFNGLSSGHLNHVQRYITRMERERKAREAGLG